MGNEEYNRICDLEDAVIRLQERVRALERANEIPDNAFWGQLMFDLIVFAGMIVQIIWHFGG